MFPSRTFFIALCFLTTTILSSRLCGVMLVHKLGKMCRITTEETCSKLNFEDVNIPIMVAQIRSPHRTICPVVCSDCLRIHIFH
ncbi:hypothetical protein Y032_0691g1567 [Ancylostoma ceylanicum]|uniref:Secreted protein n=1 Tax=Ancylostoma ceylanicum TaxID=53326 RepID=A0A016WG78_9BILA|nr:hypothetical protein Y032_0691g1567 [Ancylostoma ceylanicum]